MSKLLPVRADTPVLACALVLVVWASARPSNDRDWQPEVAVLPTPPSTVIV